MPNTTNLMLPLLTASQSQKHVTHNEALLKLDLQVQLSVVSRSLTAPPGSPVDGDRYIVATGATGAWASKDLNVAAWQNGAWVFLAPRNGWTAYVESEAVTLTWTGSSWVYNTRRPNTTVLVPADYSTVAAALAAVASWDMAPGQFVTVMIQTGHQIATPVSFDATDFRHVVISSVDAEVQATSAIGGDTNIFEFKNCVAPRWNILLDCNSNGRNGVWLENATMLVMPTKGVRRAGASGTLNPRGCGFFAWKGSSLQSVPSTGPLTGIVSKENAWRGIDITHNSQASIVAADLTDNGTLIPISNGHAALFVSRASSVQADNAVFDGSINGIRAARSIVSARSASYQNIGGVVVRQFEGGIVNVSDGNMTGSGAVGYPLLLCEGADVDRPQGGGFIVAESSVFDNAVSDIATVRGSDATIILDNSTGSGLMGRIASGVNGKAQADRCTFSAHASSTIGEALLASFGMEISAMGLTWTGNANIDYTARAIEDGYISVAGSILNTVQIEHLRVEDAGQIYSDGATMSGSPSYPALLSGPLIHAGIAPAWANVTGKPTTIASSGLLDIGAASFSAVLPPSGEYMLTANFSGGATGTITGAADRLDLFPWTCRRTVTIDAVSLNCTTGVSSALAKVAVYSSDANGRPNTLLFETSDADLSTTGVKDLAASYTFISGITYWFAVRTSSTAVLSSWQAGSTPDINGGAVSTASRRIIRRASATYASAAPSPWTWSGSEITNANATAVWLRVA